ncbi:MAG TPA: 5'/3'-nucleotidase SurE [Haloplasmataceae bacterium]
MNILVVNDDGYQAKGLKILAEAYKKYGNIFIVAPHIHHSGASSSITVGKSLLVHQHEDNLWSVEGTPIDCVKYALFGLKLPIDLVVSGVNNGFNIGIDTIYSGTIGATMEALFNGYKAIAFSTDRDYYDVVIKEIDSVIKFIFDNDLLGNDYLLSVNFPRKGFEESKGILITDLAIRPFNIKITQQENEITFERVFSEYQYIEDTDIWAYKYGYTSITPLKLGNGDSTIVANLKKRVKPKISII